jgi:ubiquinone/menaquinone biosynthesis C-methylase UbiE
MAYTVFDRLVAWFRFRAALPHIRRGALVCDIGCGLGARFLQSASSRISFGVGIDYQFPGPAPAGAALVCGNIAQGMPFPSNQFDHAVMLAVLEHLQDPRPLLGEVFRILAPGGSLIMTWPSSTIDPLLNLLRRARWVSQEMESDYKHQERIPLDELVAALNEIGFTRCRHQRFECGLNNLLIAHKPP